MADQCAQCLNHRRWHDPATGACYFVWSDADADASPPTISAFPTYYSPRLFGADHEEERTQT